MSKFVSGYSKVMDRIVQIIKIIIAIALVLMVVITFVEVIRRYAFGKSFVWAEELNRFLMVGMTFIGGAAAYKLGGMAAFDLILTKLSVSNEKAVKILTIIDHALVGAVSTYLAYNGFVYTFSPVVSKMTSSGLKVNMLIPYITIPIGFTCITLFAIEHILKTVDDKKGEQDS